MNNNEIYAEIVAHRLVYEELIERNPSGNFVVRRNKVLYYNDVAASIYDRQYAKWLRIFTEQNV